MRPQFVGIFTQVLAIMVVLLQGEDERLRPQFVGIFTQVLAIMVVLRQAQDERMIPAVNQKPGAS